MQTLPYSQVPAALPSPTLTNPDMILPDSSPTESSPSTPGQHQRMIFPPKAEGNEYGGSGSSVEEKSRIKGAMYSPFRNGVLRRHDPSMRLGSNSERGDNRIKFEKNRLSFHKAEEFPVASSPTLQGDVDGHDQRIYTEGTEGDYENGEGTYQTPAILEEDESDPNSHAAMTKRAEEILANAKKRLTNMEGNLNRARSTLQRRPSSSMSSYRNRSPEPVSLYTIPNKGRSPSGFSPSKHRQANLASLNETKAGHSRVFSETSVPSSLQTVLPNGQFAGGSRAVANGLGIEPIDETSQERHSEPNRTWFWGGLTRNTSLNHTNRHVNGLQALNEDGPAPQSFEQRAAREDDIEEEEGDVDLQSPVTANFDAQHPPATGLTRARSTNQMHDIREQMQDLKGKISTLKKRAREDNMRRRSEQSLRTPSPFTAAKQWYTGAALPEDTQPEVSGSERERDGPSPQTVEDPAKYTPQDSGQAFPAVEQVSHIENSNQSFNEKQPGEPVFEAHRASVDLPEDATNPSNRFTSERERFVLVDELPNIPFKAVKDKSLPLEDSSAEEFDLKEDSLYGDQDYHEASTSPIVERHEDRPDAFDYEHSVLNSAFGAYSGVGVRRSSSMRKRGNSQSSESSVETTKPRNSTGEAPMEDALINGVHGRQNSVDSVSTDNTFATADEGQELDESQDDWTFGQTMAGSRHLETVRKPALDGISEIAPNHLRSNGIGRSGSKKHIASAQKGHPNGVTPEVPPIKEGTISQPPDLLTVLSATGSWQEGAPPVRLDLGERDKELLERLVKSLAKVCSQVHTLDPEGSKYEARVLRRKLDAARRVLDGEMNGEAF